MSSLGDAADQAASNMHEELLVCSQKHFTGHQLYLNGHKSLLECPLQLQGCFWEPRISLQHRGAW